MRLPGKIALGLEIVFDYVRVKRDLGRNDLPTVMRRIRARAPRARTASETDIARLARAVHRTLQMLPVDSRCLMQSLVLSSLLAKRGVTSSLVIGVVPGEAFAAHAWVEHLGRPLLNPGGSRFERLVEL